MSTTTPKITKKDRYNEIISILANIDAEDYTELVTFCENEIALLDKKAAKAKETAAAKKSEKDELCAAVEAVLTDELQTRDGIANQIEGDDVSVAKVGNRLTKLVALGVAEKGEVSAPGADGKSRKLVAYKLASASVDAE